MSRPDRHKLSGKHCSYLIGLHIVMTLHFMDVVGVLIKVIKNMMPWQKLYTHLKASK